MFLFGGILQSVQAQSIITGDVKGIITACVQEPSASPFVQQFNVNGSGLTASVTVTASSGFEVSVSRDGGYATTIALTPSGGNLTDIEIYVRAKAAAVAGAISGKVTLTSPGITPKDVAVNGIIKTLPVLNPVSDQVLAAKEQTQEIAFSTGSGVAEFSWTNSTPSIGLPASGKGNIPSFVASNTTLTPIEATITVTPVSATFAYVPDASGYVSVINASTREVVTTIHVGGSLMGVCSSADGKKVYVTNHSADNISVISTATNTVTATIPTGSAPLGIVTGYSKLFVANRNANTVSVFYAVSNTLAATIPVGSFPNGLALSSTGKLYVSEGSGKVTVINAIGNKVDATISVGMLPQGLAVTPDGTRVYVANGGIFDNSVSVINTSTNTVVATIPVGQNPYGVAVSPDGRWVYVSNTDSHTISVINTATNQVVKTIGVSDFPYGVSVSPDGAQLVVVSKFFGKASVINTATYTVDGVVDVGSLPTPLGNFVIGGAGCAGESKQFKITVNPLMPEIVTSQVTGVITACAGSASISPQLQRFTVSCTNLVAPVTVTAPSGFEISAAHDHGYASVLTFSPGADATIPSTVIYVRSTAQGPGGLRTGNVVVTSSSAPSKTLAVKGVISALPSVEVKDIEFITGLATTPIMPESDGNYYHWTNSNPAIGLAVSGSGNSIPSFMADNGGGENITSATITVKPVREAFAYVMHPETNAISVINKSTRELIDVIQLNFPPSGIALHHHTDTLYVANRNANQIALVNTRTNNVVGTINTNYSGLTDLTISQDGTILYAISTLGNIVALDATTGTRLLTLAKDADVAAYTISPDGSKLYFTHDTGSSLSVRDIRTDNSIAVVTVGASPFDVAFSPDGSRIYVCNLGSNTISVIDAVTNKVISTIPSAGGPSGIIVSSDGSLLYVKNSQGISILNSTTHALETTISISTTVVGMSMSADGRDLYLANYGSDKVLVIDTETRTIAATLPVQKRPGAITAFIPDYLGCEGPPSTFTITIKPVPPTINAGAASGEIVTCEGTTSQDPKIQQFMFSAIKLVGPVSVTAPEGFEVSTTPGSGYGSVLAFTPGNGEISGAMVYVRAGQTNTAGFIKGDVELTSAGAVPQHVRVIGVVKPKPVIDQLPDVYVSAGDDVAAVQLASSLGTVEYTWSNDNTTIGLAGNGTGTIPSFKAVNNSGTPVNARIKATATSVPVGYFSTVWYDYVWVLDSRTNKFITKIKVGETPFGIAVSRDGKRVYTANEGTSDVSVISTASNAVIATVPVDNRAHGVVVSPDNAYVYIAHENGVSAINTSTYLVEYNLPVTGVPFSLVTSPDGGKLYITTLSNTVVVIDTRLRSISASIPVMGGWSIAIHPDGSRVYVPGIGGALSVINTATNSIEKVVDGTGNDQFGIAITPDGSRLYISNRTEQTISVFDTEKNALITKFPLKTSVYSGGTPYGVSVNPEGTRAYVTLHEGGVYVIDTKTNKVSASVLIDAGGRSMGNSFTPGGCTSETAFNMTVYPPGTLPELSVTGVTGSISSCSGSASQAPELQQFSMSGTNLIADVIVTAPDHFEVSTSSGSGYARSVTLARAGNALSSTTIYIRAASGAAIGTISGNVVIAATGATPRNVAVSGVISSPPLITSLTLPVGKVGETYAVSVGTVSSGYTYTATGLPTELTISPSGTISGTPTTATTSALSIQVTASGACTGSASYALSVSKGSATISLSNTEHTYDGTAKGAAITTTPAGLPANVTYNASASLPVNAGIYDIVITVNTAQYTGNTTGKLVVNKAAQQITFGTLVDKTAGDAAFSLSATTSSGLPVSFSSSNPAVAVVDGNTVTIKGPGVAEITAAQNGNTNYSAAAPVVQRLTIKEGKAVQEITFAALPEKNYGEAPFALSATASSGLPVSFSSSNPAVAVVDGNTVTIKGPGVADITAAQNGNTNYFAAAPVVQRLTIKLGKATQDITFAALPEKKYGDAPFMISATASSGLAVTYTSSNLTVASITGNKVTIKGPGAAVITATQSGNVSYLPATVSQTLTVNRGAQQITFGGLPQTVPVGSTSLIMGAFSSSGLPVSYATDNTTVAEVSGRTLTIKGAGWVRITAMQHGNETFAAATPVSRDLYVSRMLQSITFDALPEKYKNDNDFAPVASSTSGLPITFNTSNTKVAVVVNDRIRIVGAGTAVITATQAGNDIYEPAQAVKQTLVVRDKDLITGVEEPEGGTLSIFPNPAVASITISAAHPEPGQSTEILVSNSHGQVIMKQTWNGETEITLDVSGLQSGIYHICLSQGNKMQYRKFVKL